MRVNHGVGRHGALTDRAYLRVTVATQTRVAQKRDGCGRGDVERVDPARHADPHGQIARCDGRGLEPMPSARARAARAGRLVECDRVVRQATDLVTDPASYSVATPRATGRCTSRAPATPRPSTRAAAAGFSGSAHRGVTGTASTTSGRWTLLRLRYAQHPHDRVPAARAPGPVDDAVAPSTRQLDQLPTTVVERANCIRECVEVLERAGFTRPSPRYADRGHGRLASVPDVVRCPSPGKARSSTRPRRCHSRWSLRPLRQLLDVNYGRILAVS